MKKYLLFGVAAAMLFGACSHKNAPAEVNPYNYEASIVEVGAQGTAIVKAWGVGKNMAEAKENAKRNAVHSILFKGFPSTGNVNSTDLRPMITDANAEQTYKDYFADFFADGGKYQQFVQFTDPKGEPALGDVVRKCRNYKVGMVVTIDKNRLRSELENVGIIKKFGIN